MATFEIEAAAVLRGLAHRVEIVEPGVNGSCEIDPKCLTDGGKKPMRETLALNFGALSLGASDTAIYSISLPEADPVQVHQALTAAREDQIDQRCYSQVLKLPANPTTILYVGSSHNLRKRLMEHLGFGQKKIYSLHLRWWALQFGKIRIDVRFYAPSTDKLVLRALEDHLASKLIPLFGRRGSV